MPTSFKPSVSDLHCYFECSHDLQIADCSINSSVGSSGSASFVPKLQCLKLQGVVLLCRLQLARLHTLLMQSLACLFVCCCTGALGQPP
jgi:hypothetical protein